MKSTYLFLGAIALSASQYTAVYSDIRATEIKPDISPAFYDSEQACKASDSFAFWQEAGDRPYCYNAQGTNEWHLLTDDAWQTEFKNGAPPMTDNSRRATLGGSKSSATFAHTEYPLDIQYAAFLFPSDADFAGPASTSSPDDSGEAFYSNPTGE